MAFDLPPAGPKYDKTNENQARKATELALAELLRRLEAAEASLAAGGGSDNAPTASFSAAVDNTDVTFTDTSRAGSAPIVTWAWNFGDSGTSTLQNPSHTYAAAGVYTVTLTVTDGDGRTDDFSADVTISVPAVGPTADFAFNANGLTVQFTGTSVLGSAPIVSRSWTFGDGAIGSTGAPSHTYAAAGTYSVKFTVTDSNGLSDDVTKSVTVAVVGSGLPLLVGPFAGPVGGGPGDDTNSSNPWTYNIGLNPTTDSIIAEIAAARANGQIICYNFAGPRQQWLPGGTYDPSIYRAKVDRFIDMPEVADAVNDGIVQGYIGDEFNLFATYSGSVSPRDANDMGLYLKSKWPGILTVIRMAPKTLAEGWSNTDGVHGFTNYTGIDYAVAQYARSAFNQGKGIEAWLDQEKATGLSLNIGLIPTINWLDGPPPTLDGLPQCWDYLNTGSSSGVIIGTTGVNVPDGTYLACSDPRLADETKFVCTPAQTRLFFDIVNADPDYPATAFWTYPRDSFSWYDELQDLYYRSDFVAEFTRALNNGKARTTGNGWRAPK